MDQKSFSVLLSFIQSSPFDGGLISGVAAHVARGTRIRTRATATFFIGSLSQTLIWYLESILPKCLLDRSFDFHAIARHVGCDFDERQRGGHLALGLAVAAGLVKRHGVIVVVLLFAAADRTTALERADGSGEVARSVQPLGYAQCVGVTQLRCVEHRAVKRPRRGQVAIVEGAIGVGER